MILTGLHLAILIMEMQSYRTCQLSRVGTEGKTVMKNILQIPGQDRLAGSLAEFWVILISQESKSQSSAAQEKPFFP